MNVKKVASLGFVVIPLLVATGVFLLTTCQVNIARERLTEFKRPLATLLRIYHVKTHRNETHAPKKDFIYLVQAESCLPTHLSERNKLGNGNDRDVIVLAWKSKCNDFQDATLPHVEYIFDRNKTWGSGRNILFQKALEKRKNYLYYVFLDEDITFSFTDDMTKDTIYNSSSKQPLDTFENFLRGVEPALGLANFCSRCGKILPNSSYVPALCCAPRPEKTPLPIILPVSISFDAAFNAFHRKAIKFLLPYKLNYENTSWWESQKYVILLSDILFRGQVLRYNGITALNTKHRRYPQKNLNNWKDILADIKEHLPAKYHNLSVFKQEPVPQLPFNVTKNVLFTPRWNVSLRMTKLPIIPLAHFQNQTPVADPGFY